MHQNDSDRLEVSWNALASTETQEGWRTIPLATSTVCTIHAGCHFPGGEEAILISFPTISFPEDATYPQANGFSVSLAGNVSSACSRSFVALSRRSHASREMFSMMATDVLGMLERHPEDCEADLLKLFVGRIRGWQEFMERGAPSVLGPDAELGLVGELVVLRQLIEEGVLPRAALDAWQGTQRSLHDFVFGTGAIEVKSTTASIGFTAHVGSLDQFDENTRHPLFCCSVRFSEDGEGYTLPEHIQSTTLLLHGDLVAISQLENHLLQAGYLPTATELYTRRLHPTELRVFRVEGEFPRLTRSNVPAGVVRARYNVELDTLDLNNIGLSEALNQLESE